jgi:hypothetical protein
MENSTYKWISFMGGSPIAWHKPKTASIGIEYLISDSNDYFSDKACKGKNGNSIASWNGL